MDETTAPCRVLCGSYHRLQKVLTKSGLPADDFRLLLADGTVVAWNARTGEVTTIPTIVPNTSEAI